MKGETMKRLISILILLLFCITAPAWAGVTDEQRRFLSNEMINEITKTQGQVCNVNSDSRLNQIFQKLVAHTSRKEIKYRISIVNKEEINAYAMPDGRVVLLSGLIEALPKDDPSPLAYVIGHELSHIEKRHGEKKFQQSLTTGIIISILTAGAGNWIRLLGTVSHGLVTSGYSRDKEYEADTGGLELMEAAGYDPNGALVTLRLFQNMSGNLQIFPTHPKASDRYKSAVAWMQGHGIAVVESGAQKSTMAQVTEESITQARQNNTPSQSLPATAGLQLTDFSASNPHQTPLRPSIEDKPLRESREQTVPSVNPVKTTATPVIVQMPESVTRYEKRCMEAAVKSHLAMKGQPDDEQEKTGIKYQSRPGLVIPDIILKDRKGVKYSLSTLTGEKTILIYMWSNPSSIVKEDMSRLQVIADEMNCEVIAIHINPGNRKSTIKMLLTATSMNIRYPNLFDNGKVKEYYRVTGETCMVMTDTEGKETKRWTGFSSIRDIEREMRAQLQLPAGIEAPLSNRVN
ncbi:MAG: M48 family metalloprotease [Vulcanimicrobiota bacterium]